MAAHREGRIVIRIARADNGARVLNVRIGSSRPANAGRLFEGRDIEDVLALAPSLFAVCGMAHLLAARLVLGAGGAEDICRTARAALAETAREHVLRMALAMERPEALAAARPLMNLPARLLQAGEKLAAKLADELAMVLQTEVFGMEPQAWLAMDDLDVLRRWAKTSDGLAARWLGLALAGPLASAGDAACRLLPKLAPEFVAEALHGPRHADFMVRPELDGEPAETGPFARRRGHPLVAAARRRHGAGLLARSIARLVDLACAPGQMREMAEMGMAQTGPGGEKVAQIQSPRGILVHSARCEGRRVVEYRILAPTEWNFHPRGVAQRAIASLRDVLDDEELARTARLVAEAMDPCVGLDIRVTRDA